MPNRTRWQMVPHKLFNGNIGKRRFFFRMALIRKRNDTKKKCVFKNIYESEERIYFYREKNIYYSHFFINTESTLIQNLEFKFYAEQRLTV